MLWQHQTCTFILAWYGDLGLACGRIWREQEPEEQAEEEKSLMRRRGEAESHANISPPSPLRLQKREAEKAAAAAKAAEEEAKKKVFGHVKPITGGHWVQGLRSSGACRWLMCHPCLNRVAVHECTCWFR